MGTVVSVSLADYYWNTSVPKTSDKYIFCFNLNAYSNSESTTLVSAYTPSQYSLVYQNSNGTTGTTYTRVVRLTFPGTLLSISAVIDQFKEAVKSKVLALCPTVTVSDVSLSEGKLVCTNTKFCLLFYLSELKDFW